MIANEWAFTPAGRYRLIPRKSSIAVRVSGFLLVGGARGKLPVHCRATIAVLFFLWRCGSHSPTLRLWSRGNGHRAFRFSGKFLLSGALLLFFLWPQRPGRSVFFLPGLAVNHQRRLAEVGCGNGR